MGKYETRERQEKNNMFIEQTASKLNIDEEIVRKVISFQWKKAKEATTTGSIIEISGMGRFQVRMNQVEKTKAKFHNFYNFTQRELDSLDREDERWYSVYKKLKNLEKDLEFLDKKEGDPTLTKIKNKKNELRDKEDLGGSEE